MTEPNPKPADIEHVHAVVWIDHLIAKIFPMGREVGEVVLACTSLREINDGAVVVSKLQ